MTAIIDWVMSKFGLYGLLAIALVYGAKQGYEHYTGLTSSITTLTSQVADRDKTINDLNTSVSQAGVINHELQTKLSDLRRTYQAINKANDELQGEKASLQQKLSVREQQLTNRINEHAETDQCVNTDIPDDINSLLNDAEREARASASYHQDRNHAGKSTGQLDKPLPGTGT